MTEERVGYEVEPIDRWRRDQALEQRIEAMERRVADLEDQAHKPTMKTVWRLFDNYMKGEQR